MSHSFSKNVIRPLSGKGREVLNNLRRWKPICRVFFSLKKKMQNDTIESRCTWGTTSSNTNTDEAQWFSFRIMICLIFGDFPIHHGLDFHSKSTFLFSDSSDSSDSVKPSYRVHLVCKTCLKIYFIICFVMVCFSGSVLLVNNLLRFNGFVVFYFSFLRWRRRMERMVFTYSMFRQLLHGWHTLSYQYNVILFFSPSSFSYWSFKDCEK